MISINTLLSEEVIKKLAIPSNYRLGKEIAGRGGVEFIESEPLKVVAKVKGGQSNRTVMMLATKEGLDWKCTCTNKKGHFCKHCVAIGLSLLKSKEV